MADVKTFNILEAVTGRTYPTDIAYVVMDEGSLYELSNTLPEIGRLKLEIDEAVAADEDPELLREELARTEKKVETLRSKVRESTFQFHLQGIPAHREEELEEEIERKYKGTQTDSKNVIAKQKLQFRMTWAAFVTKIVSPDGSEDTDITVEKMGRLQDTLPNSGQFSIARAISKLSTETSRQFEMEIKDIDFLSGASPEA